MTKEEEERIAREKRESEARDEDRDRAARLADEEKEADDRRARDRRDADRRHDEESRAASSRPSDDGDRKEADDLADDQAQAAADPAAAKGGPHASREEIDRNAGTYAGGAWIPPEAVRHDAERDAQSGREKSEGVQVSESKKTSSQEWAAAGLEKEKLAANAAPDKQQDQEEEHRRGFSM